MTDADSLTDDFVAGILAKDAKESSIKYSAVGIDAFLPSKGAPANKPKPNTRFLRNIIRETDNHNAALLAKETAESRARLQSLVNKDSISGADIRRRQLGQIAAHLTNRPAKRRQSEEAKTEVRKRRRNTSSPEGEPSCTRNSAARQKERHRYDYKDSDDEERSFSRRRSHTSLRNRSIERSGKLNDRPEDSSRARSRSPNEHQGRRSRHSQRSTNRRSAESYQIQPGSFKGEHRRPHHGPRSPALTGEDVEIRQTKGQEKTSESKTVEMADDSDPLDDIIGPRPPPTPKIRSRGRGTKSAASGIDFRFSLTYDPTTDVQIDPEDGDEWDQALEALRDRQKWRQQGADRLRSAGFTEEEVEKWKKGGKRREEDVRWAKKGEDREWDKGKVFSPNRDDELPKNIDLNFGRLKGT